jgi:putative phosphoesterase
LTRIGLISDTHGYLDENVFRHFKSCNEIWHAGDFGSIELARQLSAQSNIDDHAIRSEFPEQLVFLCEGVKVMMRHIGGSPPKYNPETRKELLLQKPLLFISGHSHILKVIYDDKINCLHINPGAAGKQGWHKTRTLVRLVIDGDTMRDCEIIELDSR